MEIFKIFIEMIIKEPVGSTALLFNIIIYIVWLTSRRGD